MAAVGDLTCNQYFETNVHGLNSYDSTFRGTRPTTPTAKNDAIEINIFRDNSCGFILECRRWERAMLLRLPCEARYVSSITLKKVK